MSNRKGQVELAKEKLVKAVNQILGIVRRNGRSVEAFLRFVERYLGGLPGLMKIFKLR
jgi:hypothetical protein